MSIPISTLQQLEALEDIRVQPIPTRTASDATTAEGTLRGSGRALDCKVVPGNLPQRGVSSVDLRVPLDMTHSKRLDSDLPPTNQ